MQVEIHKIICPCTQGIWYLEAYIPYGPRPTGRQLPQRQSIK